MKSLPDLPGEFSGCGQGWEFVQSPGQVYQRLCFFFACRALGKVLLQRAGLPRRKLSVHPSIQSF
jgi:hypothetical protein